MAAVRKRQRQQQRKFDQFFESFSNCDEMLQATQKGELSTAPKKPSKKSEKEKEKEKQQVQSEAIANLIKKKEAVLPWPFDDLLLLQNYDGRWLDVDQIYECLNIPVSNYFTNGESGIVFRNAVKHCCLAHLICP